MTIAELLHQRVERFLELSTQRGCLLARLVSLGRIVIREYDREHVFTTYHLKVLRKQLAQEFVFAYLHQLYQIGVEGVAILFEKTFGVVEHHAGKVIQSKRVLDVRLRLQVIVVLSMSLVQFVQQRHIGSLWEFALLVDQRHDVHRLGSDQVQRLLVVHKLNVLPVDRFEVVLLLLQLEDVSHKELLQVLVRVVDAKLFEAVDVEVFETEDVQHSDRRPIVATAARQLWLVDGRVDFVDNPDEHAPVDALDQGVADVDRLLGAERGHHNIALRYDRPGGDRFDQALHVHRQYLRRLRRRSFRFDHLASVQIVHRHCLVLDVAEVQQRAEYLDHLPHLSLAEHEHLHRRSNVGKLGRIIASLAGDRRAFVRC